jgi:hypothetical protein
MAQPRGTRVEVNREQLAHVLRAAATIAEDGNIVVIGSQAILGSYSENELPREALLSMEADIAFADDPYELKADRVDGAIGEYSDFHEMNAYYAQGVSVTTAVLPDGWETRLVAYNRPDAEPGRAHCLEAHDLVVSKLVVGREKDIDFTETLIGANLINVEMLRERAELLPRPGAVIRRVQSTIDRCAGRARRI